MTVIPFKKAAQSPTPITAFERDLSIQFETLKQQSAFGYLFVTLDYNAQSSHSYTDPASGKSIPSIYQFIPVDRDEDPIHAKEVMEGFIQCPQKVVMILDLHGAPLEKQIPDWKAGTIHFPDSFVQAPILNFPPRTEHPMSEEAQRFFAGARSIPPASPCATIVQIRP